MWIALYLLVGFVIAVVVIKTDKRVQIRAVDEAAWVLALLTFFYPGFFVWVFAERFLRWLVKR